MSTPAQVRRARERYDAALARLTLVERAAERLARTPKSGILLRDQAQLKLALARLAVEQARGELEAVTSHG